VATRHCLPSLVKQQQSTAIGSTTCTAAQQHSSCHCSTFLFTKALQQQTLWSLSKLQLCSTVAAPCPCILACSLHCSRLGWLHCPTAAAAGEIRVLQAPLCARSQLLSNLIVHESSGAAPCVPCSRTALLFEHTAWLWCSLLTAGMLAYGIRLPLHETSIITSAACTSMCDTPAATALLLCNKAPQRCLHAPLPLYCLYDCCCVLYPPPPCIYPSWIPPGLFPSSHRSSR